MYHTLIAGNLHFAGARFLESQWPEISAPDRLPVIILELRGRNNIGATLVEVIESFYDKVKLSEGVFYITELEDISYQSLQVQVKSEVLRGLHLRKKTPVIGESTAIAVHEAEKWLAKFS